MIALLYRFRIPIAALCVVLALAWVLNRYVADAVQDDRQESAVAVHKADARADDIAGQVAASEAATVEKQNDEARKVAADSADPLADGLRSLRDRKASHR